MLKNENPTTIENVEGYNDLLAALGSAYFQASSGKGKERHSSDLPFVDQPILSITRRYGQGFAMGQIEKKCDEANGMIKRGEYAAAKAELQGAIIYAAALIIYLDEKGAS